MYGRSGRKTRVENLYGAGLPKDEEDVKQRVLLNEDVLGRHDKLGENLDLDVSRVKLPKYKDLAYGNV